MKASCRNRYGALALVGLGFTSGCYTTTVRSGKPAADATAEYDGKWHSGVVWGLAELSGPYDLSEVCPNGWSEITTETSFLNGLVDAVTSGIYNPQTITVRCAAGGASPQPTDPVDSTPDEDESGEAPEPDESSGT